MACFTGEDAKVAFNLFCCVYGIGTLGMPGNFSSAGPVIASIALFFMACVNVYASVACSKVLLAAPHSVKTYGDLGEWSMGTIGRILVVVSQMGVCLLISCAFLVLGGILLEGLFPQAFSQVTWIVFMALMVLPVCLTPTLKEGAGAAFAGCMGTIIADIIGVLVLLNGMSGHGSVPKPDISLEQIANTFGNLSLAYGAAIVIPALQRQHSDPKRMPRVVGVTMTVISILFLTLASSGYSAVGCQISGNLLFSIYPDSTTGLSKLGFKSNWGAIVMAYLFMQLHITIAFSVVLHPAFFIAERLVLGMHQKKTSDLEALYEYAATPVDICGLDHLSSKQSVISMADIEHENIHEDESADYNKPGVMIKYITLRVIIIIILVIVSVLLKDHFLALNDFVGASAITMSCIILPIVFYLKTLWKSLPLYEKAGSIIVLIICLVLGCYVTYTSGKELFAPAPNRTDDINFPYCSPEFEHHLYYNPVTRLMYDPTTNFTYKGA